LQEEIKATLYLFSLLFYTPTPNSLEEARRIASSVGYRALEELLDTASYEDLLREYTRAFHGGPRAGACPPYESFYREGLIYGDTSVTIAKLLRERGYELAIEGELADHIAVELELASLTLDRDIIRRLEEWVPELRKCLETRSQLYAKLAVELEELLKQL
jgi:nitrate reductase assembly molybdenum cofactor insertion protein NarJ